MNKREVLAKRLYTAYSQGVGGVAFNGDKLPTADEMFADSSKQKQIDGWMVAAESIEKEVDKAESWDKLDTEIFKFYDEENPDYEEDADLCDIGEKAATAFGYL